MPDSDVSAELRMLRAKAYGPGDGLSAEELARLQELEGRLRPPDVARPEPEQMPEPAPERVEGYGISVPDASTGSASGNSGSASGNSGSASGNSGSAAGTPSRRRWPLAVAASGGILAIGFGIGWGIWGWDSHASSLAAAHGDTQAELEAEQLYDPGTIVPVAEQHGVVIWRADRSDGEELCVLITGPEQTGHGCVTYERLAESMWPSATGTVPDGEEKAGQSLAAGLIPTATGELVPFVQVWEPISGWESQYSEEELGQLREIESAGHMGSALSILGHDGDTVVWGTWENGDFCVLVPTDDGIVQGCAEDPGGSVSLVTRMDGVPTRYIVTQSERRPPQLTVYKNIDTEYYFGSDDEPQFDDLVIDDRTGEPGE